jgi:flagellar assembly factor FliW
MTIQLDAPRRTHLPERLHLAAPMPGLAGYEDFTLTPLDDAGVLYALRSEPAGARPVRLFVVDPQAFFPDYEPSIDPGVLDSIGTDPEHAVRLVVVRPAEGGHPPTANLLAPLVLDPASGTAVQTVLTEDWPLRAPLGPTA